MLHFLLLAWLPFGAAYASETTNWSLDPLIITASRSLSRAEDMPAFVRVIDRSALHRMGFSSLEDALAREAAGLDLDSRSASQTRFRQLSMRGLGDQTRTLVTLDGVPIHDPRAGWVNWDLVAPAGLDRVEIIHGAVSSLYGSGAIGGVINLVPRMPSKPIESQLSATYGELGTQTLDFYQGAAGRRAVFSLAGRIHHTDGYIAEKRPASYNVKRQRDLYTIFPVAKIKLTDASRLTLGGAYARDRWVRGRQFFKYDNRDAVAYAVYERELDRGHLRLQTDLTYLYWIRYSDKAPFTFQNLIEDNYNTGAGGAAAWVYPTDSLGKWTIGSELRYWGMRSSARFFTPQTHRLLGEQLLSAAYLQNEIEMFDRRLLVALGGRVDQYRNYGGSELDTGIDIKHPEREGSVFSPRVGARWRLAPETALRASIGRGIQIPKVGQLYHQVPLPTGTVVGNPNLAPETAWSYEAGADHAWEGATVKTSLYFVRGTNFIAQRTVIPGVRREYSNVGTVEAQGAELELAARLGEHWRPLLAYTYNRSRIVADANPANVGHDLGTSPRNKFAFGMDFDAPELASVSARANYKDNRWADIENKVHAQAYWTADLGVARRFGPLEVRLDIENLFDRKYDVFDSAQPTLASPGRLISGTLRVDL